MCVCVFFYSDSPMRGIINYEREDEEGIMRGAMKLVHPSLKKVSIRAIHPHSGSRSLFHQSAKTAFK